MKRFIPWCFFRRHPREGATIRSSLDFLPWKDRKAVVAALKHTYQIKDAMAPLTALDAFADGVWGIKYPAIAASWRRHWTEAIPFVAFLAEVR